MDPVVDEPETIEQDKTNNTKKPLFQSPWASPFVPRRLEHRWNNNFARGDDAAEISTTSTTTRVPATANNNDDNDNKAHSQSLASSCASSTIASPPRLSRNTSLNELDVEQVCRAMAQDSDDDNNNSQHTTGSGSTMDEALISSFLQDDDDDDSTATAPLPSITVRPPPETSDSPVSFGSSVASSIYDQDNDDMCSLADTAVSASMQQFLSDMEVQLEESLVDLRKTLDAQAILQDAKQANAARRIQDAWRTWLCRVTQKNGDDMTYHLEQKYLLLRHDQVTAIGCLQHQFRAAQRSRRQTAAAVTIQLFVRRRQQHALPPQEPEQSQAPTSPSILLHQLSADMTYSDSKEAARLLQTIVRRYTQKQSSPSRVSPPVTPPRSTPNSVQESPARRLLSSMTRVTEYWKRPVGEQNDDLAKRETAALVVQLAVRRYLAQQRQTKAAVVVQEQWRSHKHRVLSLGSGSVHDASPKRSIVVMQSILRGYHARGSYIKLSDLRRELAAVRIQSQIRGAACRDCFRASRVAAVLIQRQWRACMTSQLVAPIPALPMKLSDCVTILQALSRRYLARKQLQCAIGAVIRIQRIYSVFRLKRHRTRMLLADASSYFKASWSRKQERAVELISGDTVDSADQALVVGQQEALPSEGFLLCHVEAMNVLTNRIRAALTKAMPDSPTIVSMASSDPAALHLSPPNEAAQALLIQRVWRRHARRQGFRVRVDAATKIQLALRRNLAKRSSSKTQDAEMAACLRIQRAFLKLIASRAVAQWQNSSTVPLLQETADVVKDETSLHLASTRIQNAIRRFLGSRRMSGTIANDAARVAACVRIQQAFRSSKRASPGMAACNAAAVITLQVVTRRYVARRQFEARQKLKTIACIRIQRKFRTFLQEQGRSREMQERHVTSARLIEHCWLQHLSQKNAFTERQQVHLQRSTSIPEFVTIMDHSFDSLSGTLEVREPPQTKCDSNYSGLLWSAILLSTMGAVFLSSCWLLGAWTEQDIAQNVTMVPEFCSADFPMKPVAVPVEEASGVPDTVEFNWEEHMIPSPLNISLSDDEIEQIHSTVVESYGTMGSMSMCSSPPMDTYVIAAVTPSTGAIESHGEHAYSVDDEPVAEEQLEQRTAEASESLSVGESTDGLGHSDALLISADMGIIGDKPSMEPMMDMETYDAAGSIDGDVIDDFTIDDEEEAAVQVEEEVERPFHDDAAFILVEETEDSIVLDEDSTPMDESPMAVKESIVVMAGVVEDSSSTTIDSSSRNDKILPTVSPVDASSWDDRSIGSHIHVPMQELWTINLDKVLLGETVADNSHNIRRPERLVDLWAADLESMFDQDTSFESEMDTDLANMSEQIETIMSETTGRTNRYMKTILQRFDEDVYPSI